MIISPLKYFCRILHIFKGFLCFQEFIVHLLIYIIFFLFVCFSFYGRYLLGGTLFCFSCFIASFHSISTMHVCIWLSLLFISVKHANDSGSPNAAVTKGELNASVT